MRGVKERDDAGEANASEKWMLYETAIPMNFDDSTNDIYCAKVMHHIYSTPTFYRNARTLRDVESVRLLKYLSSLYIERSGSGLVVRQGPGICSTTLRVSSVQSGYRTRLMYLCLSIERCVPSRSSERSTSIREQVSSGLAMHFTGLEE